MMIRCTAKLLKEMGLGKSELTDQAQEENALLGDWYANLFYVERRKCLIFSNSRTLYSFMLFDLDRASIKNLSSIFRAGLEKALSDDSIAVSTIEQLSGELKDISCGKTHDKSVLGTMNDHVRSVKWIISDNGGLDSSDASEIIKHLNRIPLMPRKYAYSIEELKRVLGIKE